VKKFALITNFNIYDKAVAAMQVAEELLSHGVEVLIPSVNKDRIFRMHKSRKEYRYLPWRKCMPRQIASWCWEETALFWMRRVVLHP
jgi:hypothetical protein